MITNNLDHNDPKRTKVIACATVMEEMQPFMPSEMGREVLEFGLHADPDKLRKALQNAIDLSDPVAETILLGYGLCSRAVTGLKSETRTLVIPKIDDCIGIFLGSLEEYNAQHRTEPGTLYQTKGWIEAGQKERKNHAERHKAIVKRYGEEKARSLMKQMIKNYTRMVFINTGNYEIEHYREYSRKEAARQGLRYEEIMGSNAIVKKLLCGPWDKDIVIIPPGKAISFLDFR
jgi:hypothetical protein